MKNFGIKSDLVLDLLRNDVKKAESKTFERKEGEKKLSDHSLREYNSKGERTLAIHLMRKAKFVLNIL